MRMRHRTCQGCLCSNGLGNARRRCHGINRGKSAAEAAGVVAFAETTAAPPAQATRLADHPWRRDRGRAAGDLPAKIPPGVITAFIASRRLPPICREVLSVALMTFRPEVTGRTVGTHKQKVQRSVLETANENKRLPSTQPTVDRRSVAGTSWRVSALRSRRVHSSDPACPLVRTSGASRYFRPSRCDGGMPAAARISTPRKNAPSSPRLSHAV